MKTRYRNSILGESVLQIEEPNTKEIYRYWRDAKPSDIKILEQQTSSGFKHNWSTMHKTNWLGKIVFVQDFWTKAIFKIKERNE